jgi:hypothetical protein
MNSLLTAQCNKVPTKHDVFFKVIRPLNKSIKPLRTIEPQKSASYRSVETFIIHKKH